MFNLAWVKIKELRTAALLHGGSQLIPHFESQEFYGNSGGIINGYSRYSYCPLREFLEIVVE